MPKKTPIIVESVRATSGAQRGNADGNGVKVAINHEIP
jgi:hypothetical protein